MLNASQFLGQFLAQYPWVLIILSIWTIPWKAWALWRSARSKDTWWFIALTLINTLGILEIVYLYVIRKSTKPAQPAEAYHEPLKHDEGAMIKFADFQKIHLRVAKILSAEKIEESDKLIRLQVDLGDEKRQIIAGIGKTYQPGDLDGKEIVIVANLEPRKLMGYESQGMLLAASDGNPVVLMPEKEVPAGSKIS